MTPLRHVYDALRARRWDVAGAQCRRVLVESPDCAPAHHALALSLCGQGRHATAADHLRVAHRLAPDNLQFRRELAGVLAALEQWEGIPALLSPVLGALDAEWVALYLAAAVRASAAAAAVVLVEADCAAVLARSAHAQTEYGKTLAAAGQRAAAERVLRKCIGDDPSNGPARRALAAVYERSGCADLAIEEWRHAARLCAENGTVCLELAVALVERARLEESRSARLEAVHRGLQSDGYAVALRLMLFDEHASSESILAASRAAFPESVPPTAPPPRGARRGDRRLRIGYLSGEFHQTPAFYFLTSFLARHDRSAVDVFVYNSSPMRDEITELYPPLVEHWREVSADTDDDILRRIDRDGIDVLVDLSGHFPGNRLRVFARRGAAVQATFPNYPASTGCRAVDYLFTDLWTSPDGTETEYSERLHRLSCGYLCYAPPPDCPAPLPNPFRTKGRVTFGMFQQAPKLSVTSWDLMAAVLREVPDARLLMHSGDLELDRPGSLTVRWYREQFAARDVDPLRVSFVGPRAHHEHLRLLQTVDIALDTIPYNGQTTTMECLWMGVPVVTAAGRGHVGRVGPALLERAGLGAFAAGTAADYVRIARDLAASQDTLVSLRVTLRQRVIDAGLTDGVRLARELEAAYCSWA